MNTSPPLRSDPSNASAVGSPTISLPSTAELQARLHEATALLKALANPDRLLLLCQLVGADRAVADLAAATGLAQPTLSQQLAVLRNEGLVATRRDGKFIHYRIASPAVHAVLQALHGIYCNVDGQPAAH